MRVWNGLSIGADALYRRLGYTWERSVGGTRFFEESTTSHWEAPIFVKYKFGQKRLKPFVLAGGAFEHAHTTGTAGCLGSSQACGESGVGTRPLQSDSWGGGYLVGGGVETTAGRIKIAPEFRYTRWVRGYLAGAGSNQPALLLGIRF